MNITYEYYNVNSSGYFGEYVFINDSYGIRPSIIIEL